MDGDHGIDSAHSLPDGAYLLAGRFFDVGGCEIPTPEALALQRDELNRALKVYGLSVNGRYRVSTTVRDGVIPDVSAWVAREVCGDQEHDVYFVGRVLYSASEQPVVAVDPGLIKESFDAVRAIMPDAHLRVARIAHLGSEITAWLKETRGNSS